MNCPTCGNEMGEVYAGVHHCGRCGTLIGGGALRVPELAEELSCRLQPEPAAPATVLVCRNCGDRFDGEERDCPQPSPGRPYVDCGRGGHWFDKWVADDGAPPGQK